MVEDKRTYIDEIPRIKKEEDPNILIKKVNNLESKIKELEERKSYNNLYSYFPLFLFDILIIVILIIK